MADYLQMYGLLGPRDIDIASNLLDVTRNVITISYFVIKMTGEIWYMTNTGCRWNIVLIYENDVSSIFLHFNSLPQEKMLLYVDSVVS